MFKLTIASPEEIVYDGEVQILNIYTINGQVGILPNHVPFVDIVKDSEMHFTDKDGKVQKLAVSSGWLFVWTEAVTVFVNASEFDYEIDLEKAEQGKILAEQELANMDGSDVIQQAHARASLEKTMNRIRIASNKNRN